MQLRSLPFTDPRDKRLRPSVLLQFDGKSVLIDTTPDFRAQVLRGGHPTARRGALHPRPRRPYPRSRRRPPVQFLPEVDNPPLRHRRNLRHHPPRVRLRLRRRRILAPPVGLEHHRRLALRAVRPVVYPDPPHAREGNCLRLPLRTRAPTSPTTARFQTNRKPCCKIWTSSSSTPLRRRVHPAHTTLDQAVALVDELQPRRAFFTHMCHDLGHASTEAELRPTSGSPTTASRSRCPRDRRRHRSLRRCPRWTPGIAAPHH